MKKVILVLLVFFSLLILGGEPENNNIGSELVQLLAFLTFFASTGVLIYKTQIKR